MADLNPQIERDLVALAVSPGFLLSVLCFPQGVDQEKKRIVENGALDLHSHAKGRQILTLFGNDKILRFDPSFLTTTLELVEQYEQFIQRGEGQNESR
jgi:hypothetical protein